MKRISITVLGGLLMCVFASPNVWAQATAQISGTATDATGALLPGVEITATQIETGISRTAVTNETGAYNFPNLPLGPFQVEAVLPGFQTFLRSGLVLQVNADLVIDAVMEVGQVSQTIEVTAKRCAGGNAEYCAGHDHRKRTDPRIAAQWTQRPGLD